MLAAIDRETYCGCVWQCLRVGMIKKSLQEPRLVPSRVCVGVWQVDCHAECEQGDAVHMRGKDCALARDVLLVASAMRDRWCWFGRLLMGVGMGAWASG